MNCARCGTTENLTSHHMVPVRDGGGNEATNIMILCSSCHPTVEAETKQGFQTRCYKCGNEWRYTGKNQYWATCPRCLRKVKVTPQKAKGAKE